MRYNKITTYPNTALHGIVDALRWVTNDVSYDLRFSQQDEAQLRCWAHVIHTMAPEGSDLEFLGYRFCLGIQGHGTGLWDTLPTYHLLVQYEQEERCSFIVTPTPRLPDEARVRIVR
jgi:hypothetical protein